MSLVKVVKCVTLYIMLNSLLLKSAQYHRQFSKGYITFL
jgi:hypothetical protein